MQEITFECIPELKSMIHLSLCVHVNRYNDILNKIFKITDEQAIAAKAFYVEAAKAAAASTGTAPRGD